MKILHLLNDGPNTLSDRIIETQKTVYEIKVIDFSLGSVSYETLVDEIFASDKVISW